jgi:hypothetical protein
MAGSDCTEPSFIGSPQPRFVFLSRVDCMQLQKIAEAIRLEMLRVSSISNSTASLTDEAVHDCRMVQKWRESALPIRHPCDSLSLTTYNLLTSTEDSQNISTIEDARA